MNSLLTQSNKYNLTLTTSSIQLHSNHFSQNHRSEKRLQNMRNKQLLTSTEIFKSNKPKPIMFSNKQNAISYSSSIKNTEESIKDSNTNNCNICYNKKAFLTKQNKLKTSICESQKQLDTGLHLNKMRNENIGKKVKQVSIDLQNKYNKIFHKKTYTKKKRKESCEVGVGCFSPMPYEGGGIGYQDGFVSMNSSLKKQRSCYGRLVKRSLSRPILNTNGSSKDSGLGKNKRDSKKKFQFKPRSNTYYIKSNNYLNSNYNTITNNKLDTKTDCNTNTNTTTAPQSQVFSSISTLQTLFKITELEPKQITSHEQIKELEELNHKLNLINSNNINTNINSNTQTPPLLNPLHNPKCNIINAEMLETSSLNTTPQITNEDVYISSNNRLQTYKLLLDCITTKFSEIQDIVHNDMNSKFIYGNTLNDNKSINRMSELHSKIEFTQDNIPKQTKHITKRNVYDIDDNEMEEKTNAIIPEGGHSKTEPNEIYDMKEMNEDSFLQYKLTEEMMEPTMSMNSDLGKTFLEVNYEGVGCNDINYYNNNYNNENIVSFLSNYQNEIKSFLQQNGNINHKEGIDITNNNNTSEFSDVIINNTNDTITTITQSNQNTFNNTPLHSIHHNKVNNNEDNKCLIY